ncbi:hypothetical protein DAI22_01g330700 [Oryza sativa Japonica Group]|nr:hypothetical protein DAI22_01g330700 [Oryza sativa Japonica Group]
MMEATTNNKRRLILRIWGSLVYSVLLSVKDLGMLFFPLMLQWIVRYWVADVF